MFSGDDGDDDDVSGSDDDVSGSDDDDDGDDDRDHDDDNDGDDGDVSGDDNDDDSDDNGDGMMMIIVMIVMMSKIECDPFGEDSQPIVQYVPSEVMTTIRCESFENAHTERPSIPI